MITASNTRLPNTAYLHTAGTAPVNNGTVHHIQRLRLSYNLFAAETSRTKFTFHQHSVNRNNSHASDNNCTRSDQLFFNHPTPSTGPLNVSLFPTQYLGKDGRERDEYGTVSGHVTWRDVSKLDLSADRLWQLHNLPQVSTVSLSH